MSTSSYIIVRYIHEEASERLYIHHYDQLPRDEMVLPSCLCESELGLKKGMHVNISFPKDGGDRLIVQPLTSRLIQELRGSLNVLARRSTICKRSGNATGSKGG